MPANKSSLRVIKWGDFIAKVIYQKYMFFTNIGNDYLLKYYSKKNLKITFYSASNKNQAYICSGFHF